MKSRADANMNAMKQRRVSRQSEPQLEYVGAAGSAATKQSGITLLRLLSQDGVTSDLGGALVNRLHPDRPYSLAHSRWLEDQ